MPRLSTCAPTAALRHDKPMPGANQSRVGYINLESAFGVVTELVEKKDTPD